MFSKKETIQRYLNYIEELEDKKADLQFQIDEINEQIEKYEQYISELKEDMEDTQGYQYYLGIKERI
ncbi:hypothetical protein [Caloranaerobacter sp. DY30410]|uniref:hypothetical protein n=1 Tax=Caloranaerobacter sp. DY30410 TaxID=3238305 RepID=UPI003D0328B5